MDGKTWYLIDEYGEAYPLYNEGEAIRLEKLARRDAQDIDEWVDFIPAGWDHEVHVHLNERCWFEER